ncbi:Predicted ferric reductase [Vibrio xiamenensis]|uniref:Predicted ferric reductase n=1 Tax=Vibrio xiamenensis TaxID=861298 RepID=A0A1G8ANP9_9VIBR|nr:ferric reductase-like transmembrane domain-containing protein [Vibrio xiamenensis]SDH22537.1 Predicted ferric reductase [Vibrio xiamenensis]
MRKQWFAIGVFLAAISLIWWQAAGDFVVSNSEDFFRVRASLIQLTGLLALSMMSIAMLLVMRFAWVERMTNGLDKSYHLHKWLGISAVVTATLHWLLVKSPRYLIDWGVIAAPNHGHSGWNVPGEPLQAWVAALRPEALLAGEWSFYALIVLSVIALVSAIGYKPFKITHKLMALCFIAVAFHSILLIKRTYWSQPITYVVIALAIIGTLAALYSLFGRIGQRHTYLANVVDVDYHSINKTTRLTVKVTDWPGHRSGQYAYLKCAHEQPHPFTITSYDEHNQQLEFLIKELGDFTCELKTRVQCGDTLQVEGPYGRFEFDDEKPSVWIAGGVGIAAFKAILAERAKKPCEQNVRLYYCTLSPDPELIDELNTLANRANIILHVIDNRSEPKLNIERLTQEVPDLLQRSIWFCGPSGFANALKTWLTKRGFPSQRFHCEYFEMR